MKAELNTLSGLLLLALIHEAWHSGVVVAELSGIRIRLASVTASSISIVVLSRGCPCFRSKTRPRGMMVRFANIVGGCHITVRM